ncbi:peptidylprolyl isomerase [Paenibacillus silviterrae]|uniref:peptidylprolyl isomerase n=1 Tax=Paenibacillus silviterrae TaxID=3242194 RepID=UPI002543A871|nr:peptidylprolyl isomerase [Paenibacillus chinjuensis]
MMKDKFQGLVLGLTLGLAISGSVAYASGTQIEVYFQNLKYMFDGIEKKPTAEQGAGFIYNGTTYVPLRFVSEALGKDVAWDGDTETIYVGKKINPASVAAEYEGGQVTMGELLKFLKFRSLLNPQNVQYEEDPQYREYMLNQLVGYTILHGRANDTVKAQLPEAVSKQLEQTKQSLVAAAPGKDFAGLLTKNGLTDEDFNRYMELLIASDKTMLSELAATSKGIQKASVRHILIGFQDEQGKERTKEEASKKAQEILAKLKAGQDFAALAKQYSEDPGSKDNGGLYANADVNNWVEPFKKATVELELNKISELVETDYGYHIIRVENRSVTPFDKLDTYEQHQLLNDAFEHFMQVEVPTKMKATHLE